MVTRTLREAGAKHRGKTVQGVAIVGAARVAADGLAAASSILVAAILGPTEFGLFGVMTVLLTAVLLFSEGGMTVVATRLTRPNALQIKKLYRRGLLIGLAGGLVGIAFCLGFALAFGLGRQDTTALIIVATCGFQAGYAGVAAGILARDGKFGSVGLAHLFGVVAYLVSLSVGLLVGGGLVAVACAFVVRLYISLFALVRAARRSKTWSAEEELQVADSASFSGWLMAAKAFGLLRLNIDYFAILYFGTRGDLGVYTLAFLISISLFFRLAPVLQVVLTPVFAGLSRTTGAEAEILVSKKYSQLVGGLQYLSVIWMAILVTGISLGALDLLGLEWQEAKVPALILSLNLLVRPFDTGVDILLSGIGRVRELAILTFFQLLVAGLVVVPVAALSADPAHVSWAVLAAGAAGAVIAQMHVRRVVDPFSRSMWMWSCLAVGPTVAVLAQVW